MKLTSRQLDEEESVKATACMKLVGDYERIADHAVNILESAEEMRQKGVVFTERAKAEYRKITAAVNEILELSYRAFFNEDYSAARKTEPLEQVIDKMKETMRTNHILRLQKGECTIDSGSIWSDLLTDLERAADHCSNISGCFLDTIIRNMKIHENLRAFRNTDEDFRQEYQRFERKYGMTVPDLRE